MAILFSGLNINAQEPADLKYLVDSIEQRNALSTGISYQGMLVFVRDELELFVYQGETGTNTPTEWVVVGAGGGTGITIANVVEDGNGNAVSSEAVFDAIQAILPQTITIATAVVDGDNDAVSSDAVFEAIRAIQRVPESAESDVASAVDDLNSALNLRVWTGTINEYNAIADKDSRVLYNITNDFVQGVPVEGGGSGISDLSAFSTTDLSEGNNLYYTETRVDDRITASNPIQIGTEATEALAGNTDVDDVNIEQYNVGAVSDGDFLIFQDISNNNVVRKVTKENLLTGIGVDQFATQQALENFITNKPDFVADIGISATTSSVTIGSIVLEKYDDTDLPSDIVRSGTITDVVRDGTITDVVRDGDFLPSTGRISTINIGGVARAIAGVGDVSGTLPITTSGTDSVVVAINAATENSPGSMSAGDKTKVDNISITQAVDLDTIETDTSANNDKISFPGFGTTNITALRGDTSVGEDNVVTSVVVATSGTSQSFTSGQLTIQAEVGTGTTPTGDLTSIVLNVLEFQADQVIETFTITGVAGTQFDLSVVNTTPVGWLTSGALSATSGAIPTDGTFEGTLTIPATMVSVDRTAEILATNSDDVTNIVSTGLFRQQHTQAGMSGNLVFAANSVVNGVTATFSGNATAGDFPLTIELFEGDPAADPTLVALQTATLNAIGVHTFTSIDTTALAVGDHDFYIRASETGQTTNDVVIEMETITIGSVEDFSGEYARYDNHYRGSSADVIETISSNLLFSGTMEFVESNDVNSGEPIQTNIDPNRIRYSTGRFLSVTFPYVSTKIYTNTSVSPNVEIDRWSTTIHEGSPPSFSDIVLGTCYYFSNDNRITCHWNLYTSTALPGVTSYGYDYVLGESDSIPEGSNRFTTSGVPSNQGQDEFIVSFQGVDLSPLGELTMRCWLSDGTNFIYGTNTTFTPRQ